MSTMVDWLIETILIFNVMFAVLFAAGVLIGTIWPV